MNNYDGKFIVIEGPDGSGTTTQRDLICEWMEDEGYDVVSTHEPVKEEGRIGKIIDEKLIRDEHDYSPQAIGLAFAADRKIHVEDRIIPALEEGKHVISDRYYHSSLTYQPAHGVDEEWVKEINKYAINPDLTVILDVPVEESMRRLKERDGESSVIFETTEFQEKLRQRYRDLEKELNENVCVIDGDRSIEEVNEEIKDLVREVI
ncbi:MAG: dTMP kinase [Candidatus Aenigmatarchaeota archaeon]